MKRRTMALLTVVLLTAARAPAGGRSSNGNAAEKVSEQGALTIVVPPTGEKAYQIAGNAFVEMWERVTRQRPSLIHAPASEGDLPPGDVVLIGSDAVQPIVHALIRRGVLDTLELQYGTDSYRILCVPHEGRRHLIVAGGSGRSTLYAVYDFFHRQAGVEYFWDGDAVPRRGVIKFDGIDVSEKPRFRYRGLRYFAHRGLHRFQAEHWDLEDWQREIDWLVKKRFNLFMLEYLAKNSWQPRELEASAAVKRFCRTRYPGDLAPRMEHLWSNFLVTSQTAHWSMRGTERVVTSEPQFHMLASPWLTFTPQRLAELQAERGKLRSGLEPAPEVLAHLAALSETYHDNVFWRRDALDMARTIANRALLVTLMDAVEQMEAWRKNQAGPETIRKLAQLNRQLLDALSDVLALSDDFSMTASFRRLEEATALGNVPATVNPHSEQTLKGNAENDYCRSHHYELARYVYRKEAAVFWDYVLKRLESTERTKWGRPPDSAKRAKAIEDEFFATSLPQMVPQAARGAEEFAAAFQRLEYLIRQYLASTDTR